MLHVAVSQTLTDVTEAFTAYINKVSLTMEAASISKKSVNFYLITRLNIPEGNYHCSPLSIPWSSIIFADLASWIRLIQIILGFRLPVGIQKFQL